MSAENQHGDMVAISAHLKLDADLKDEIYNLEHENAVLRVELEQQAICNRAGAERELALRSTITELQRENAALLLLTELRDRKPITALTFKEWSLAAGELLDHGLATYTRTGYLKAL